MKRSMMAVGAVAVVAAGAVIFAVSGGDSPGRKAAIGDTTPAGPVISASPSSLFFTRPVGGAAPAAQSLKVSNTGTGSLSWTASSDQSWLVVTPASGTAPSTVSVSIAPTGLTLDRYYGTITLSSPGTPSVAVSVSYANADLISNGGFASGPLNYIDPANEAAQVTASQGKWSGNKGSAAYTTMPVISGSTLKMIYNIAPPDPYELDTMPDGTVTSDAFQDVAIPANATSAFLSYRVACNGTYSALATLRSQVVGASGGMVPLASTQGSCADHAGPDGWITVDVANVNLAALKGSTQRLRFFLTLDHGDTLLGSANSYFLIDNVSLSVSTQTTPTVAAAPWIAFTSIAGNASPAGQAMSIYDHTAATTLTWTASSTASWLTLSPASGSASGTPGKLALIQPVTTTLSVTSSAMPSGTYFAAVKLTAGSSTFKTTVTLTITPNELNVGKAVKSFFKPLSFSQPLGGPAPAAQGLAITTTGTKSMTWTASADQPWVKLSATTGVTPANISVSMLPAGLTLAQYHATISVTSPGVTSASVPVIFSPAELIRGGDFATGTIAAGSFRPNTGGSAPWAETGTIISTLRGSSENYITLGWRSPGVIDPVLGQLGGVVQTRVTIPANATSAFVNYRIACRGDTPSGAHLGGSQMYVQVNPDPATVIGDGEPGWLTIATNDRTDCHTPDGWLTLHTKFNLASRFRGNSIALRFFMAGPPNDLGGPYSDVSVVDIRDVSIPESASTVPTMVIGTETITGSLTGSLVADQSLHLEAPAGSTCSTQACSLRAGPLNGTYGTSFAWAASTNAAWLQLSTTSGTALGSATKSAYTYDGALGGPITVTANSAGLARGNYTATITITAPGAVGAPATIPVSFTVY